MVKFVSINNAKNFIAFFAHAILLLLLVSSPVNSKIAGACWVFFCVLGIWSFKFGTSQANITANSAAKVWFSACLLALTLRALPQFYWGDSWEERHAEVRLLLGALGLLGLVHYGRFTTGESRWLGYGVVLATWAAFCLMVFWGLTYVPTNQIPWGASIALLVCVVLPLVVDPSPLPLAKRLFYVSGVIAGLCAVFLSQARGSYGIVIWISMVLLWYLVRGHIKWRRFTVGGLMVVAFGGLLVQALPNVASVPIQRVELAVTEFALSTRTTAGSANSSVGARLYMWQRAITEFPDHLLMGVGHDARKAAIHRWGAEANAPAVSALGHLHNDYLQSLFDHGLFALLGFLTLIAGIFLVALCLRKESPLASLGLAGILFMHASSSLTNMNFAHNYYPTMLSISIGLCFLIYIKENSVRSN